MQTECYCYKCRGEPPPDDPTYPGEPDHCILGRLEKIRVRANKQQAGNEVHLDNSDVPFLLSLVERLVAGMPESAIARHQDPLLVRSCRDAALQAEGEG